MAKRGRPPKKVVATANPINPPWSKKVPTLDWQTQRRLAAGGRNYQPAPMPTNEDIDAELTRMRASRLTSAMLSPKPDDVAK